MAAHDTSDGGRPPPEFGEDLATVVELVRDFAALQTSETAVVQTLIGVVADLQAQVDLLLERRDSETAAAGRHAEMAEQLESTRVALRGQAHQLRSHAEHLHQHADRLRKRAESLTERASELMHESQDIVAAREARQTGTAGGEGSPARP